MYKMTRRTLASVLALTVIGCAPAEDSPGVGIDQEPTALQIARRPYVAAGGDVEIYFTRPGTARGEDEDPEADDAIVEAIESATTSIDLCLYEFKRPNIIEAAVAAVERGVTVRFAGDGDELDDTGYIALEEAGVDLAVRKPRDRIMHNKFAVIDGQIVFTGSMNFSENGVQLNNNHTVRFDNAELAAEFTAEFEKMYNERKFGRKKEASAGNPVMVGGTQSNVYFSPQDGIDEKILELLQDADTRVYFMIFAYTHVAISDRMVELHNNGVEVVGIFDESQARGRYSVDEKLAKASVPVFLDGNENAFGFAGGKLHHKVMLIDPSTDDPVVLIGSYNWSNSATYYNDENLMVLRGAELVAPFVEEFCGILEVANTHPDFEGRRPDPCANLLTPVRINEIMANPAGRDGDNEWVELINTGTAPLNLEGWQIGDGTYPDRHVFDEVIVPPQGSVVVYSGPSATEPGRIVASSGLLGLANNSDEVVVRDPKGVVIDQVAYKAAYDDISFNRDNDGGTDGDFVLHDTLSGQDNSPGTQADGSPWPGNQGLMINELFPNPTGTDAGNEFVEIVNAGTIAFDLDGWYLGDLTRDDRHVFGPLVLEPGESVVVFDSGDHSAIPNAINSSTGSLSLNNSNEEITLYNADGVPVDIVRYVSSTDGQSLNRGSDADPSALLINHDQVTGAIGGSSPGVRVDGSLFTASAPNEQITINELLPNPDGPDAGNEFVEILNTGTQTVDMTGWILSDAIADRHVFDNVVLAPGDAVVVWDSGSHSGDIIATTGTLSLNNTGDSISLRTSAGAPKTSVVYQGSTSGKSLNRANDGEAGAPLVNHDEVSGASGNASPGTRADGSSF